ncbi:hypothetical protein ACFWIW_10735 [Amycolatopsis sp. NPDC058340]|uniref:hypothetical protein n=1 Tax=Amycolatopsis sp. NPDC058340 TaxID=3346453 RepID=UPI003650A078
MTGVQQFFMGIGFLAVFFGVPIAIYLLVERRNDRLRRQRRAGTEARRKAAEADG